MAQPEDLLHHFHFPNNAYVGWSGFTGVGYPKRIPTALAEHVEKNNLQGKLKYNLFVGASSGAETENRWARNNMIERRAPHQVGKEMAKGINNGNINFFDKHLSMFPSDLVYGFYTKHQANNSLDVAVVEASCITECGGIIPGASVGASPEIIQMADKIIIQVNTSIPSFQGLHDITFTDLPPHRKPYLITGPEDRIGTPHIPIDPEKVIAMVESNLPDQTTPNTPADADSKAIASHLISFLKHESAASQAVKPTSKTSKVWTEVLQDTFLDLFDSGNLDFATATSIRFSPEGFSRFFKKTGPATTPKLLLRSQALSNSPEIIRRLGVIAMNTPVEVDIYAPREFQPSSPGPACFNGLGGSADFSPQREIQHHAHAFDASDLIGSHGDQLHRADCARTWIRRNMIWMSW
ncbi:hypothetical protein TI39_contig285g00061 [Zymoseptoria brevis]|uniref:Acetyl-CoA hydrolase n=1 Tax=Zymoseptoria brevis TaxID=1047168 RepID=A0A0F4GX17_9PEZI|nr:hypothetical protein TI39_contig285g00061 [Zymoseptoria brevis]